MRVENSQKRLRNREIVSAIVYDIIYYNFWL